jgi:hypothetical protein
LLFVGFSGCSGRKVPIRFVEFAGVFVNIRIGVLELGFFWMLRLCGPGSKRSGNLIKVSYFFRFLRNL